jgi:hypothetical protein
MERTVSNKLQNNNIEKKNTMVNLIQFILSEEKEK